MSNNMIYVETDQLKACASEYDRLADQFQNDWKIIESKLKECENYWQGSFTTDMDNVMKKVKKAREDIYENTIKLSTFIKSAADLYVKYDGDIAKALQDNPSLNAADYPDNVKVSEIIPSADALQTLYNQIGHWGLPLNPPPYHNTNCVSLSKAKAKYNGFDISNFTLGGENGYSNLHDTDSFSVTKYTSSNESTALQQLVANEGQPLANIVVSMPHPHTIYIDKIENGIVYFSDNTNLSDPKTCSVDSFPGQGYNGTGYNITGVAHLKKKH